MKKIILTAAIGLVIFSCEKEENQSTTNDNKSVELSQLDKDASYVYGITLGQNAERYNQNPELKDSLNFDEVKKGISDFLEDSDKLDSYAYGLNIGKQIKGALDNKVIKGHLDKEEIILGMMDYINKKELKIPVDSVSVIMDEFYQTQLKNSAANNKKAGAEYLAKVKSEEGAQTTASGLVYKVIQEGSGPKVKIGDKIKVKYKGSTIDGKVFDSTELNNDGEPVEFVLQPGGLIQGWVEGMTLMSKGAKYTFYIPSELGYGDQGSGAIAPGDTLIFEIELVDVSDAPAPAPPVTQPGVKINPESPAK